MNRKMFITLLLLAIAFAPTLITTTQDDPAETPTYPTLQNLNSTNLPPADSVDLAQRLRGVTELTPPEPTSDLAIGTQDRFFVSNSSTDTTFEVNATLQATGDHVYMWVQEGLGADTTALKRLAESFDERIYEQMRELWGSEPNPGIDGDPRVHVLFARGVGSFVGAYFARRHTFPEEVLSDSNEREMFVVNYDAYAFDLAGPVMQSTLAHEFQHMIRNNIDSNEDTWLNEAFSTFTEVYLGYGAYQGIANSFLFQPDTQLNTFGLGGTNRANNYGAGFMFLNYFYDRYGIEAVQALSADSANGLISVDRVLQSIGEPGVDEFFADWVLANLIQDSTSDLYGYTLVTDVAQGALSGTYGSYPVVIAENAPQYSTQYHALTNLSGFDTLTVSIQMPETAELVPAPFEAGDFAWYSNRGDVSNSRLTRAFDLTSVESATLQYDTWFSIEEGWDYVYLVISADGGETWTILPTSATTEDNPHGNAYGPGYSGESNGWLAQEVSLDAYVGQEILVRFEMVTDDAVTQPGLLIDNVQIPEIGYFSAFNTDDGGWQSEGWVLMDNVLPQQAWVQAVQYTANGIETTRRLAPEALEWALPLTENVQQVVIAVSPFAPVTTVEMPYSLKISGA